MSELRFFWLPKEVLYYVVIPLIIILLIYFIFTISYNKKKGTYYYNYVMDYVYSTFGIVFCSLLFCLLVGYSIATLRILIINDAIERYLLLAIILVILPIIPTIFLIHVIKIYIKNLKRKVELDEALENIQKELVDNTNEDVVDSVTEENSDFDNQDNTEVSSDKSDNHENKDNFDIKKENVYEDVPLVKKKN